MLPYDINKKINRSICHKQKCILKGPICHKQKKQKTNKKNKNKNETSKKMRPIGVQMLDFHCSSVSVFILLLGTNLVSPYINHSAVYILFWSFEISDNILRNQK